MNEIQNNLKSKRIRVLMMKQWVEGDARTCGIG